MNLFINSSKSIIDVMLFDEEKILNKISMVSNNNHTIILYECLDKLNIDFKNIKKIYVINGPGSYTGLRVGIIFSKTLAQAYNIDIYPVRISDIYDKLNYNCAIDLRGNKFYYKNQIVKELNSDVNVDLPLNLQQIFDSKILDSFPSVDVYNLEVFYAKDAV